MSDLDSNIRSDASPSISTSLFELVQDREPKAWNRFVQIYAPVVHHWCRREGVSDEESADIGQEVFRAVATGIVKFDRSPTSNFLGWIKTITRHKIADYWRKKYKRPVAVGGTDFQSMVYGISTETDHHVQPPPDSVLQCDRESENVLLTRRAMAVLKQEFTQRSWQAFWETAVKGRNATEVASDLDMTPMAVRKAKSRVLRRLRDQLEGSISF